MKLTVVKSNKVVEASYRLTLNEQRLVLACIAKIKRGERIDANSRFEIPGSEFAELFNLTQRRAYADLRDAAKRLYDRSVIINNPEPNDPDIEVTETRWVSAVSYRKGKGGVILSFAPLMIPYISQLESEFTRYTIESIAKMKSIHSIRIYEMLVQWESVGFFKVDLIDLKERLGIPDSYPAIKDFKRFVLSPAEKEINESSDITVKIDQYKEGRSIKGFIFYVVSKQPKITKKYIEENARVGETYQQAYSRLKNLS